MSLFLRNIFCLTLLTACLSGNIVGQISSSSADFNTVTAYSPSDPIFVFYQSPAPKLGSLTAQTPDTMVANFSWSKYDTLTKTFSAPFKTENNAKSSTIESLNEGGYKVHITDGLKVDTLFMAWVAFDSLHIKITKDNDGFVPYFNSTCEYFDLIVTDPIDLKNPKPTNFKYINPKDSIKFEFKNTLRFEWRAESDQAETFANTIVPRQRVSGDDIPSKDTKYYVSVIDKFGLTQNDEVTYKSIVPEADFTATPDTVDGKNSAPLRVTFINKSENAEKYTWYMGDGDTLEINTPDEHTYYEPASSNYKTKNYYKITLIAESKEQCTDIDTVNIEVEPPILKVPNVFVPEKGRFKFEAISLNYYKMTIFSRWGKKVYEETGYDYDIFKDDIGWNGKIGNNDAAEGIYYYIIEVRHWDPNPEENEDENRIINKGKYSGFFYLFRSGY